MRPFALAALALALTLGLARAQDAKPEKPHEKTEKTGPFIPADDVLAKHVLEVAKSYPTDGTHKYHWPKGSSWAGTTRDLFYKGTRVADGDPEKRCYCCGLTFEVFFRAWEAVAKVAETEFRIGDLDAKGVLKLRRDWYGVDENDRKTCQRALVESKLGHAVTIERARAGDFVQLWRADKSGHSVVLLAVEKDGEGKPTGLRYWSTQKSTNGIGERTERFGATGHAVLKDETYFVRAGHKP